MRYLITGLIWLTAWSGYAIAENQVPHATVIFAGGCFWCMEPPFDKLNGVVATTSGYIGGNSATANYKAVSSGATEHIEAVKVDYDPQKISYQTLLDTFWMNVDPFDKQGQFCDKGNQYLSYIYYSNASEKAAAETSLQEVQTRFNDKQIATRVRAATKFYAAEDYHQNYYLRNPLRYKYYRNSCGRDRRLKEIWGKK